MPLWLVVVLMGLVEGLTEFIPVSSTGHLILADHFLGFSKAVPSEDVAKLFDVFIQSGAILAILVIYPRKLLGAVTAGWVKPGPDRRLLISMIIAFTPAAAIGFLVHDWIELYLFSPKTVAAALVVGGIVMLIIERLPLRPKTHATGEMTPLQALGVGVAQIFSLFPGVSRSAATIMGGLCSGLDRPTATEFSFLLSMPIMFAASLYVLLKHWELLSRQTVGILALGFVVSFLSAWVVVKWLIRFVQTHDFTLFAAYRIVFGGVLLVVFSL